MSIEVVRLEDVEPQLWRNGGGVTRELLTWPCGGDWLLRLSVADIEQDGHFSTFDGIERWFAVLAGNGVRLGTPAQIVVAGDLPLQFDGATAPACALIDGPTRDLNLMVRRGAASAWMRRVDSTFRWSSADQAGGMADAAQRLCGVFTAGGCVLQSDTLPQVVLPAMSLAWSTQRDPGNRWIVTNSQSDQATFAFECTLLNAGENCDV